MKAMQNAKSFNKDNSLKYYLCTIAKNEAINYLNYSKKEKKTIIYSIDKRKYFSIRPKLKISKVYKITKNNLIKFEGTKKCFDNIESKPNDYFNIIQKPIIIKKIFEISSHEPLSFINKKKKIELKKEKKSFMYIGIVKRNIYDLKKENNASIFFKPNKKVSSLSKSVNEQTNQNKPKIYSFFSNFLKGKKTNTVPMRILQIQYRRNKKDKIAALNKKNSISSQNKFYFLSKEKKNKEIKYSINNAFSFNYEKIKKTKKFDIININSFSFDSAKKKIDLSCYDPEMLNSEENLKQLVSELNIAINLKNEEIKRLLKEKEDTDLANQLFNDSSKEQIESLSNSLSILKEKNEKLNEEIENLKEVIDKGKKILEEKNKVFDNDKSNLNKTIDELTKENSKLKLELFKRGTEEENSTNNKQEEKNNDENNINEDKLKEYEKQIESLKEELNKMRQSKIIETNQLKLELTKNKVEMKRLTNQIKKLETEKTGQNKETEGAISSPKINDINKTGTNSNDKEEINKLKNEIENYKNKMSEINLELKKNEELRHQNILLTHTIQEAQKKVSQASLVIAKAKKYSLCVAYVAQFLSIIKPENEKQIYLVNKLKEFTEENKK